MLTAIAFILIVIWLGILNTDLLSLTSQQEKDKIFLREYLESNYRRMVERFTTVHRRLDLLNEAIDTESRRRVSGDLTIIQNTQKSLAELKELIRGTQLDLTALGDRHNWVNTVVYKNAHVFDRLVHHLGLIFEPASYAAKQKFIPSHYRKLTTKEKKAK